MYPYFVNLTIPDEKRAFNHLMSFKPISDEFKDANNLEDILRKSWGFKKPAAHPDGIYTEIDFGMFPQPSCDLAKFILEKVARFATPESCCVCMYEDSYGELETFNFKNNNLQISEANLCNVLGANYLDGIAESCLTALTVNPQILVKLRTEEDVTQLLDKITNSIRSKLTPFLEREAQRNRNGNLPELDLCFKLDGIIQGMELEEYLTNNPVPEIEITYRNPEGKTKKLDYDQVEIPVVDFDFSKIYLDNIKTADGVNNTAMSICDWMEEITKIESIKIKGAEKSHLSVFDIEFMDVDCNIYSPKTGIADKEYTIKNGSFIDKKPDLKNVPVR